MMDIHCHKIDLTVFGELGGELCDSCCCLKMASNLHNNSHCGNCKIYTGDPEADSVMEEVCECCGLTGSNSCVTMAMAGKMSHCHVNWVRNKRDKACVF